MFPGRRQILGLIAIRTPDGMDAQRLSREETMFAVVLSGGGNYGALEAGALEVFLEAGVRPGLWAGTSAGGMNAIMMASDPTVHGARVLQDYWRKARPVPQGGASIFTATRRFAAGMESLFPNESVAEFIQSRLPAGCQTFGDIYRRTRQRAFALAVEYPGNVTRVFGEQPEDRLIDGAMATSALPPYFPPWAVGSLRYMDGAVAANLPVRVAVEYGAEEILAMNIEGTIIHIEGSGIINISAFAVGAMIAQLTVNQVEWARHEGVRVHFLKLDAGPVRSWDFTQADFLIERGRELARTFLAERKGKLPQGPTWNYRMRRLFGGIARPKAWD
ncbi:MAG: patatin-like phospholipase family protein [Anaerolineales bacterium]|nr:patatin-like phospholipase family protein [Anaerolineales bacterium]